MKPRRLEEALLVGLVSLLRTNRCWAATQGAYGYKMSAQGICGIKHEGQPRPPTFSTQLSSPPADVREAPPEESLCLHEAATAPSVFAAVCNDFEI